MGVRSVCASAAVATLLVGCSPATSPPPLPPRRIAPLPPPEQPLPRAQPIPVPAEPPVHHERYHAWTILADLAATVPLTYAVIYPERYYYAAPALVLTPFIHGLHGQENTGVTSLLMRGAAIGGTFLIGTQVDEACDDDIACRALLMSTVLTALYTAVVTVDAVFLARREVPDNTWYRLPVFPSVAPAPGGATLGLIGRF